MVMKHTKVSVAIRKGAVIDDYEEFPLLKLDVPQMGKDSTEHPG
jgi:hypothetical protein